MNQTLNNIRSILTKHKEYIPIKVMAEILAELDDEDVEAEVCEWQRYEKYYYILSPHDDGKGMFMEQLNSKPFCPYCGKPIKISEVE